MTNKTAIARSHNGFTYNRWAHRGKDYRWLATARLGGVFWEQRGPDASPTHPYYGYSTVGTRINFRTFEEAAERCQRIAQRHYEVAVDTVVAHSVDLPALIRKAMSEMPDYEEPVVTLLWTSPTLLEHARKLWPGLQHILLPKPRPVAAALDLSWSSDS